MVIISAKNPLFIKDMQDFLKLQNIKYLMTELMAEGVNLEKGQKVSGLIVLAEDLSHDIVQFYQLISNIEEIKNIIFFTMQKRTDQYEELMSKPNVLFLQYPTPPNELLNITERYLS